MALASGPASFQRFFISGKISDRIDDAFVAALNERAFGRAPASADNTQAGWVGPEHLFDSPVVAERIAFGRFAHLALRVDRLAIPANVLRSYVRLEQEAALKASGREFLTKVERRKARETALLRAEAEVREGSFRRSAAYPVLIDLETPAAYLGTLSATAADRFMLLFGQTFGGSLEPADPQRVTARILSGGRDARAIEHLAPFHLVAPPDGLDEAPAGFAAGDLRFLGREFLSWLWFNLEADEGALRVRGGDEVTVMIERSLRLQCDFDLSGSATISADSPTSLPESRAAIRSGKQPTRAGLVMAGPAGEFRFTLDGRRLSVSSLTLPEGDGDDAHARVEQRFESLADAVGLLDGLFELFIHERIAPDWARRQRDMAAWAAGNADGAREPSRAGRESRQPVHAA